MPAQISARIAHRANYPRQVVFLTHAEGEKPASDPLKHWQGDGPNNLPTGMMREVVKVGRESPKDDRIRGPGWRPFAHAGEARLCCPSSQTGVAQRHGP